MAWASFGAPVTLSTNGAASEQAVAVDSLSGSATVVWRASDGANYRVQERSVAANGTLGSSQSVSPAGLDADKPQVAVDPSTGQAEVVWIGFDGANWRVEASSVAADGTLGTVKTLSAAGESADGPEVSVDPSNGTAIVVWSRFDGTIYRLQARTVAANGTLGATKTLSAAGESAAFGEAAIDPTTGQATVVWQRFDGSNLRVQERSLAENGTLGTTKTLSAAGEGGQVPRAAVDPTSGTAIVVWYRYDGSDYRVQARTVAADGTLGTVKNLSGAGENAQFPQVAIDPTTGQATVAWQRNDTAGNLRIQSRSITTTGTLGTTKTLSTATDDAENPQLAVDPSSGQAVVVWQRYDGSHWRTQARTVAANATLGTVQTLSAAGNDATMPEVALDPSTGNATAVWAVSGIGIQAANGP
jgi:hypothetical protein